MQNENHDLRDELTHSFTTRCSKQECVEIVRMIIKLGRAYLSNSTYEWTAVDQRYLIVVTSWLKNELAERERNDQRGMGF